MSDEYISLINDYLDKKISGNTYPEIIYEAMSYSLKSGGKRMRPLLMLYTAEGFSGSIQKALPFAAAIECIHAYSLIHDDLPCMDNDDMRRGKPTNHKVYGEAMALLAGDGLLNLAYEIMSGECLQNFGKESVHAMQTIAESAGTRGMVGGQVVDIISEDKIMDRGTLLYIQENKTAAIIKSAMAVGAILAGASESELNNIKEAGRAFGIAFQIKDDILDTVSTAEILGKPIGSDVKNAKLTHVSLHGLTKSEADFLQYGSKALSIINKLELKTDLLVNYMSALLHRNF